jgi:xanthine dehydrogenase accessory factor
MKDVLSTLERWTRENLRVATATVVKTERSAPRDAGAVLAVSERGEVAGSVTGGCVEPAVYREAEEVLAGGAPRLKTFGIADDEALEVGLPCGGTVHIFVDALDPGLVAPLAEAIRAERPIALEVTLSGDDAGAKRLVRAGDDGPAGELLARGETGLAKAAGVQIFVSSFAPRPRMYIFGAVDHAAAVAELGRFLGYHVTVCDARAKFTTPERFPDVDSSSSIGRTGFSPRPLSTSARPSSCSPTTTSSTCRCLGSRSRRTPGTSAQWALAGRPTNASAGCATRA